MRYSLTVSDDDDVSERPTPVRIDLRHPTFPPEIAEIRAQMAAMNDAIALDLDAMMAQAAADTGLDDFGDPLFVEPFRVVLAAFDADANLSANGRVSAYLMVSGLLRNKLLIENLLRRHPEIHDLEVARPIIICGLPRTGTTHLHNLMSSDPALRSLPYWEGLEPVPPRAEQGVDFDVDPRWERCELALGFLNAALPHFRRMHDMYADHVHEEIQLLAVAGSTQLFDTMGVLPAWRDWYLGHDQTPYYQYLKTILKVLQWQRGGTRWVLKSPQHIEQYPVITKVFPDATFVVTHRDPVSVTASMCTMLAYSAWQSRDPVDPVEIAGYWADRLERMLRACADQRDALPADRTIDVRFDEFMADDVAMVQRIYALADQPFTPEVRAAMDAFMAEHPRGKYGGVVYELADFDLTADERYEALGFYIDRFGLAVERG